ncbi:HAD family hydrolase [Jannaschia seohaensis]|uniref:phosphoglycolate phosphatase n=1 Tax=Jannaschia seohaensis TaxID=475081 RepID=A0A2Y9AEC6_9RHOB|nr:HAD-IA family hydrolase [Jannaschia seohaensis]PWJ21218.1 phosphoglycolate phosphatase [Jannaschia seohaensis]SSA41628.1 phosphoglycolate phosphatase [Jannaschia seohaensis]
MIPQAVIFDLDGTLIDSAPSLHRAAAETMKTLGHRPPSRAEVESFVGDGVGMLVARCLAAAGAPADAEDAVRVFRQIYDADPLTGVFVMDGAREILAALTARGIRLGLCTNKPLAPTRTILTGLALGPFDAVVAGDSLPQRKPDPAPLRHAVALLGVAPAQAAYVGDSHVDAETAVAAEMRYLHVEGGYLSKPLPPGTTRCRSLSGALAELFDD